MDTIGRYQLRNKLATGGMADVYLAFDSFMARDVTLKLLPRLFMHDPTFEKRFEREARLLAQLEHPAIVPVYDFGYHEEQPYMVNRFMRGGSLLEKIVAEGRLSLETTLEIVLRICSGLAYAHQKGIVHRDLKPANILFDEQENAYIADFGIAKLAESTSTLTGNALIGTPAYMSPEQFSGSGEIDSRSDQYSLGIVLFEMLSGELPFKGDTTARLMKGHLMDPPPQLRTLRGDLPEEIEPIIQRMLSKQPDERYPSINSLVERLRQIMDSGEKKEPVEQDYSTHSIGSSVGHKFEEQSYRTSTEIEEAKIDVFATNVIEDIPPQAPGLASELKETERDSEKAKEQKPKKNAGHDKCKPNFHMMGAFCLIIVGVILQTFIPSSYFPNIPLHISYGFLLIPPLLIAGFFALNTKDFEVKRLVSLYVINLLLSIIRLESSQYLFTYLYNHLSHLITRGHIENIYLLIMSLIFSAMILMAVLIYRKFLDLRKWKRILAYAGPPLYYIIFEKYLFFWIYRIIQFDQFSRWTWIFKNLIFYLGILSLMIPLFFKPNAHQHSDGTKNVKTNDIKEKDR